MTEGTALVGAFGLGAQVYQREGARVTFAEMGLGNGAGEELFTRNLIRFRGESRLGLAVFRPELLLHRDRCVSGAVRGQARAARDRAPRRHPRDAHAAAEGPVVSRSWGRRVLPPHQAAEAMNVGEAELVDMVRGGLLEWREVRGEVYVRPAVARLLGVKT